MPVRPVDEVSKDLLMFGQPAREKVFGQRSGEGGAVLGEDGASLVGGRLSRRKPVGGADGGHFPKQTENRSAPAWYRHGVAGGTGPTSMPPSGSR